MSSGSVYRGLKCTRGYATAASKPFGPSLRPGCPPMQLQGLSGKYASALYLAVIKKDEKIVSTVEKDLSSIQRVLSSKDGSLLPRIYFMLLHCLTHFIYRTINRIDHQAVSSHPTLKQAKTVRIMNFVKPIILRGLIVDFADMKTIDLSILSRVNKMNAPLHLSLSTKKEKNFSQLFVIVLMNRPIQ
ncbi:hypothetical protein PSTT_10137 [Puccinia striiformis]|uniref:ATP synthase subunit 5, mitochondrial n=1 Tax=Puccinia striiformis TaxID=27350 RepID=A0A2S4V5S1_9BASI|nr:hypothetical protein PSTT_10137 [Puccinia striiformis]